MAVATALDVREIRYRHLLMMGLTFEDVGSAGGHQDVAGGEIPLDIFADYTTGDSQLLDIVEQVITARLVAGLNL